jgi:internalin A
MKFRKLRIVFSATCLVACVLLTVLSGCGSRPGDESNRRNKGQAAAIAEIKRLGGKVTFDEDAPGKPIYGVDFSETDVGDDALKNLDVLTELKVLVLNHTKVTDAGLKHINGLTQLHSLILEDIRVTDAGLDYIKPLEQLEYLSLSSTQVTDAGLKHISGLVKLHSLSLDDIPITDEGLRQLKGLKELTILAILNSKVTPAGRKELKQALPNLRKVYQENTSTEP